MVRKAREALEAANERLAEEGARRGRDVRYQVGDRVVLSTKHLVTVTDRGTKAKLRAPFCGPFSVTEVIYSSRGIPRAYRLGLPAQWRAP